MATVENSGPQDQSSQGRQNSQNTVGEGKELPHKEMFRRVREFDWSLTPLGPGESWSPNLRTAAQMVLESPFPQVVLWGPDLIQIYNDGYRGIMGGKHPAGLGQATRDCWPEVWHINEPIYQRIFAGESLFFEDALYPITRSGTLEDAWLSLSYSPIRDTSGEVAGVLVTVFETTARVKAKRLTQSLVAHLPGAAAFVVAPDGLDLRYRLAEGEALKHAGFVPADLVGKTIAEAVGTELAVQYEPHYRGVLERGESFEQEHDSHGRSYITRGSPLRSVSSDRIEAVLVVSYDITERKRAERRAEGLIERMSDAYCVLGHDFRIQSVNAATERLLGVSRTTLIGRSHGDVFPALADAPVGHAFRRVVAEGIEQHLTHHYTGEGYDMHLEVDAYPTDEGGVALFWRDVTERTQAQAALRESERRYRLLFENMSEGFALAEMIWDENGNPADWRYREVNDAWAQTGVPVSQTLGRTAYEVNPAIEPYWIETYGRVVQTGQPVTFEAYSAGFGKWFDTIAFKHSENRFGLIFHDVTERKNAEAALRESEEKYRALFNEMDEAYAVVEVMANEQGEWNDFLFLDANPAFIKHTGMPYPVGKTATQLLGTPNPHWAQVYGEVAATGVPVRIEEPEPTLGRIFDLNVFRLGGEGSRRVAVLFTNITARKEGEAALRESQQRFHSIANLVPDLLWESQPDGSTDWYNQRWLEYTGQSLEEAISWGWTDAIHPDDKEGSMWRYKEAVEAGEPLRQEHRIRRHDGEYRWFVVNAFPLKDENGRVVKVYGTATDIHDSRIMLEAVRESEEQFRRAIEEAPIPVIMHAEDGEVLQVSRSWTELTGYTLEDMHILQTWLTRAYGFGGEGVRDAMAQTFVPEEGKPMRAVVFDITTRQGEQRTWSFSASTPGKLRDGRRFVVGMAEDITKRKQAGDALRESEEKFRTLFDSIDEGFSIIELIFDESGKVVDYWQRQHNPAFTRMTGIQDAIGKRMSELVPELEPEWYEMLGKVYSNGEPLRTEYPVQSLGQWYSCYLSRVGGAESPLIACVYDDITERKRAEEQQAFLLKLSDALRAESDPEAIGAFATRTVAEYMRTDRCYIVRLPRGEGRGWIGPEYRSPGLPPLSGEYRFEDFPEAMKRVETGPLVIRDLLNDATLSETDKQSMDKALGLHALLAAVLRKGERNYFWCLTAATTRPRDWTDGELKFLEDVAERTWAAMERARAEKSVRENEARFRTLSDAVPQVIWTNSIEGAANYFNQRWYEYTGLSYEESIGPGWLAIVHPDDALASIERWQRALAKGTVFATEYRLRGADGTYRWFLGRNVPIQDEQGKITGWFGTATDIHELQELREELEARVAERTAELTQALSERQALVQRVVSAQEQERRRISRELHDQMGQYIAAFGVGLKNLEPKLPEDGDSAELVRLRYITGEMAKEVHRIAVELRPTSLDDLGLIPALRSYIQEWSEHVGLAADFEEIGMDSLRLLPDAETVIYRIVQEALTNAAKYAIPNDASRVAVTVQRRENIVQVMIDDNGPGFDTEAANRSGRLGLAGMRERAELVGGSLEIESTAGEGTTIYLRVPITTSE